MSRRQGETTIKLNGIPYKMNYNPKVADEFHSETGEYLEVIFAQINAAMAELGKKGLLTGNADNAEMALAIGYIAKVITPHQASVMFYYAANDADSAVTFNEIQEAVHEEGVAFDKQLSHSYRAYTYPMLAFDYAKFAMGVGVFEESKKKTLESTQA